MNEVEIWRDIPNYEGLYQASNLGRIKTLKFGKEKILKPNKNNKNGYLYVVLYKNKERKKYRLHKLILLTHMGEPVSKVYCDINHRDENKTNNKLENLEYCTRKYNNTYGGHIERSAKNHSKPVIGINKINGYICGYSSATEVECSLGISQQNVSACCLGKRKSAGGYRWYYKNNEEVKVNE